jgi:hypothetical protein
MISLSDEFIYKLNIVINDLHIVSLSSIQIGLFYE